MKVRGLYEPRILICLLCFFVFFGWTDTQRASSDLGREKEESEVERKVRNRAMVGFGGPREVE